jgi:hypothetical protein
MKTAANNIDMLRSKLHEYIERADERHLTAIYVLVEGQEDTAAPPYDVSTIGMLHSRRDAHLKGESRSYTVEESLALIRGDKS